MLFFQDENSVENYAYNAYIYDPCEWEYHFHKNYELVYVMEGALEVLDDERRFTVKKGEFALILPYHIHKHHTPVNVKVWIAVFSADFIPSFDAFMKGKANKHTVFRADPAAMSYIERILVPGRPEQFTLQAALYAACAAYVQSGDFYEKSDKTGDLPFLIFDYVKNNFKRDISLKEIALALGYDYHYLSRVYHRVFHTNFRNLLNQFRCDYALSLLYKGQSVTKIAMECGFGCVRTFNRCFIAAYGKSPKQMCGDAEHLPVE